MISKREDLNYLYPKTKRKHRFVLKIKFTYKQMNVRSVSFSLSLSLSLAQMNLQIKVNTTAFVSLDFCNFRIHNHWFLFSLQRIVSRATTSKWPSLYNHNDDSILREALNQTNFSYNQRSNSWKEILTFPFRSMHVWSDIWPKRHWNVLGYL